MNKTMKIGLCAFAGTFAGNLFMLLVYDWPSARFFTDEWWQDWTAIYAVWIIFIVIGVIGRLRQGRPTPKRSGDDR